MIIDKDLKVSDEQAVTVSAASTDVIDQRAAGDAYEALWLVIKVKEAPTAAGLATVNFKLQTDSDEAFGTVETKFESGAIAIADLTLNSTPVKVRLPRGMKRYIRTYYTVATGPLTAGKFDAFMVMDTEVGSF